MVRCLVVFVLLEHIWLLALGQDDVSLSQARRVFGDNITETEDSGILRHSLIKRYTSQISNFDMKTIITKEPLHGKVEEFLSQLKRYGHHIVRIQDYPYAAAIWFKQSLPTYLCSGSLISPNYVLTVAHQLLVYMEINANLFMQPSDIFVRLGSSIVDEFSEWPQNGVYDVKSISVHPDWHIASYRWANDLALIHLSRSVELSTTLGLAPLTQPTDTDYDKIDENPKCKVLMWTKVQSTGKHDAWINDQSDVFWVLQAVPVELILIEECEKYHKQVNAENTTICGVTKNRNEGCREDAGGALICGNKMHGILSTMQGCFRSKNPDIFVQVDNYSSWINDENRRFKTNIIESDSGHKVSVEGFLAAYALFILVLL